MHFIINVADSKSHHRLFFYPIKEKVKRTGKTFWEFFLSSGGRLWKGKVLTPFSSVVIYGLLIAWSLWNALCLCKFENILKTPSYDKLCNDSRIVENVYKVLVLKIFVWKGMFERCFEGANVRQFCNDSRIVENVYKMFILKDVLKVWGVEMVLVCGQVITSNLLTKKVFVLFLLL